MLASSKFQRFLHCHERLPLALDMVLVGLLVAAVCYFNYDWVATNAKVPVTDAAAHAYQAVNFHNQITETRCDRGIFHFLTYSHHYPLLCYQLNELFFFTLGVSNRTLMMGMYPFVALLGFSMYFLGKRLGGRLGGLCAATLACTSPLALELSREPFVDYQLCATSAFGLMAIFNCRGFSERKPSLLCGLALGLGMSTKWTFPIFVGIPLAVAWFSAWRHTEHSGLREAGKMLLLTIATTVGLVCSFAPGQDLSIHDGARWAQLLAGLAVLGATYWAFKRWCNPEHKSPLYNSMCALMVTLVLMAPWYSHNFGKIIHKINYQANVMVSYKDILQSNLCIQLTWFYCALVLVGCGLLVGLCRRDTRSIVVQLVLTWGLVLALLSNAPFDPRYIVPLLVPLVSVSACAFAWLYVFGLAPLLFFATIGSLQMSYHALATPPRWYSMMDMYHSKKTVLLPLPCHPKLPITGYYPYETFIASLLRVDAERDPTWIILFLGSPRSEIDIIQPRSFTYYGALCGLHVDACNPFVENISHGMNAYELYHANYAIVYRDPNSTIECPDRHYEPDDPTTREEVIARMQEVLPSFPRHPQTRSLFMFGQDTIVELLHSPTHKLSAEEARATSESLTLPTIELFRGPGVNLTNKKDRPNNDHLRAPVTYN